MRKVTIFGIEYSATNYAQASDLIVEKAISGEDFSVFALPVHGLVDALNDPALMNAACSANLVVPDGQPIKWAMNWFGRCNLADRVSGPHLTRCVLEKGQGLKVYLYGGATEEVSQGVAAFIRTHYPQVQLVGRYREKTLGQDQLKSEVIRDSGANLVLVGLGCPVQEKWIAEHVKESGTVMMGVGAAFGYFSGNIKHAPRWAQKAGLEWAFRLAAEPKRLWRRYLFANSYFIWLVLKEIISIAVQRVRSLVGK